MYSVGSRGVVGGTVFSTSKTGTETVLHNLVTATMGHSPRCPAQREWDALRHDFYLRRVQTERGGGGAVFALSP